MELVQRLNDRFMRMQLSADVRRQIYRLLAFMLENGNKMDSALKELYDIYSEDGKKKNSAAAVFLYEAWMRNKEGRPLSEGIARYVSAEEASMIAAGERSGRLREAFNFAIDNLEKKKEVRAAIMKGVAYPLVLVGILIVLLCVVSFKLMPTIASVVDMSVVTGPVKWLNALAEFTIHQGPYVALGIVLFILWTAWSFPNLTGGFRFRLDKYPPWSVYRAQQGTTFLLNVGVMLRSGIPLLNILTLLSKTTTPYMRERIDACIRGTNAGLNLGEALYRAELDFPDRMAVRLIRGLASRDGFDVALDSFAKEWAESTVQRVKTSMSVFFYCALLAVAAVLILVVMSFADLQNVMQAAAEA